MRYRCQRCERFVKDKFIFGLLHICLTDDEFRRKLEYYRYLQDQQRNFRAFPAGVTTRAPASTATSTPSAASPQA